MPKNCQRGFTSIFLLLFLVFMLGAAYFIWTKQPLDKPIVENFVEPVKEPEKESLIFLAESISGTLTKVPGTEQFRLVMVNPGEEVIYFADKPEARIGKLAIEMFVKSWEVYGFGVMNAPKAALKIDGVLNKVNDKSTDTLIVSLTDPVFDKVKNSLEFMVQPLTENPGGGLAEFTVVNYNFPVRFKEPKLFIDKGQIVEGVSYDLSIISPDSEETKEGRIHPIPLSVIQSAGQAEASDSALPIEAGNSGSIDR